MATSCFQMDEVRRRRLLHPALKLFSHTVVSRSALASATLFPSAATEPFVKVPCSVCDAAKEGLLDLRSSCPKHYQNFSAELTASKRGAPATRI